MSGSQVAGDRSETRLLLRMALLFLVVWIPSSFLDVLTTEIARQQGDWVELNAAGFVLPSTAMLRELRLTLKGIAAVLVGTWLRRDALLMAAQTDLNQFVELLFQKRGWAIALIGIPLFVAISRYGVVVSNACYLIIGWSPIDSVLLLPLQALFRNDALGYVISIAIGMAVLWYPVTSLIFRLLHTVNGGSWRNRVSIPQASEGSSAN